MAFVRRGSNRTRDDFVEWAEAQKQSNVHACFRLTLTIPKSRWAQSAKYSSGFEGNPD